MFTVDVKQQYNQSINRYPMVFIFLTYSIAGVSSHVDDINTRNKVLTAKLLRQGYRYKKSVRRFQKFIGGILTQCLNIMSD